MVAEGRPFRGVLFAGLMISPDGTPKTIEFNARFGDPETQVVLPRLQSDLVNIFLAAINGTLDQVEIKWSNEAAVCVVLASGGYPASYKTGVPITGLETVKETYPSSLVFHAGTAKNDAGEFVTNGGRVLGIVGLGEDITAAREQAYQVAKEINFEGKHQRSDIALKALV
jgi:phosphoribosylamine--glycine ligase